MTGQCYQSNQSSHSQGKHHNHRDAMQPETNAGLLIFKWDAGVSQIMYLYSISKTRPTVQQCQALRYHCGKWLVISGKWLVISGKWLVISGKW